MGMPGQLRNTYIATSAQSGSGSLPYLIASGTLTAPAASIDITSIATGFYVFELFFQGISDAAGDNKTINIRFNNDSGNNYTGQAVSETNGVMAVATSAASSYSLAQLGSSNSTMNGHFRMSIMNKNSAKYKGMTSLSYAANQSRCFAGGGQWTNTTDEISRITIIPSADNIATGSSYVLVGYK